MAKPTSEPVYDAQTYAAMCDGRTRIVFTALLHIHPDLREAEKTPSDWQKLIEKFLAAEPS